MLRELNSSFHEDLDYFIHFHAHFIHYLLLDRLYFIYNMLLNNDFLHKYQKYKIFRFQSFPKNDQGWKF